jgi:hypothetical protein
MCAKNKILPTAKTEELSSYFPSNESPPEHSAINQFNLIQSRQIQLPSIRLASTYTPVQ